jgi:hypothetical protein
LPVSARSPTAAEPNGAVQPSNPDPATLLPEKAGPNGADMYAAVISLAGPVAQKSFVVQVLPELIYAFANDDEVEHVVVLERDIGIEVTVLLFVDSQDDANIRARRLCAEGCRHLPGWRLTR